MSGKRVTIVFDRDVLKNLRMIQSQLQARSEESISFSSVCNDVIRKGLK